eukprot:TRINITY_DN7361_c1_g1_i1.p1 TRINITY_DN7361_c1_g1~~TRINITY_DN7361_c1_g1_i1.p1  ORF type:complete len:216 (+),score=60.61 TRINITY_DN7361_c1_g1_i1:48-695(+)
MTAKHVEELKDCLGLNEFASKKAAKARKRRNKKLKKQTQNRIVHTLASASKSQDKDSVAELVKFSSHKSKKKQELVDEQSEDENQDILSVDQMRHEIFKFGLNALGLQERNEAKVALAIKLGAKPPKNPCIPLQELKEKRQKEKEELKRRQEENDSKLINKPGNQNPGKKKGANKSGPSKKKRDKGGMKPKMGNFDGGMLKISSHELKKMKSKKK